MKRNIIESIFFVIMFGGILFSFYDSMNLNEEIQTNRRIADSLRVEVGKYKQKYDSLSSVVHTLDSTIVNQEEKVRVIKDTFIVYKTPPFNNSDSAYKYIQKFIRE